MRPSSAASGARMKGFVRFSSPMVEGMVISSGVASCRELEVRLGVLVAAVDPRVVRQGVELPAKGLVHHLRGAFEQAAAAGGEERVAAEQRPGLVEDVGHIPRGVRGDVENAGRLSPHLEGVSLVDAVREALYPTRVGRVAEDGHAEVCGQLGTRHGVVGVAMSTQDLGYAGSRSLGPLDDRRRFGSIDDRGLACGLADRQVGVVVAQGRDALDVKTHTQEGSSPH